MEDPSMFCKQGWITKRAIKSGRNWKRRFFTLTPGSLGYSKSPGAPIKRSLRIQASTCVSLDSKTITLVGSSHPRVFLRFEAVEEAESWAAAINSCVEDQRRRRLAEAGHYSRENGTDGAAPNRGAFHRSRVESAAARRLGPARHLSPARMVLAAADARVAKGRAAAAFDPWPEPLDVSASRFVEPANAEGALHNRAVRVFTCTWNMGGQQAPRDLTRVLPVGEYHLYAVGTQECERTITKSAMRSSKKRWESRLQMTFGPAYTMLRSATLQANHLAVFVLADLVPLVSGVGSAVVPTGLGDTLGNKGGVGICLTLGVTSMLFVVAHFEAHQGRAQQRNENFHRIDTNLALPQGATLTTVHVSPDTSELPTESDGEGEEWESASVGGSSGHVGVESDSEFVVMQTRRRRHSSLVALGYEGRRSSGSAVAVEAADCCSEDGLGESRTLPAFWDEDDAGSKPQARTGYERCPCSPNWRATCRFDAVFFFGDLNYRVDGFTAAEVKAQVKGASAEAHKLLLKHDQLSIEMRRGNVFLGFEEGPLNFRPTYKFDAGCDDYDSSRKQRVPSWTDRILTRGDGIEIVKYTSLGDMRISDHRPVVGGFIVAVDGVQAKAAAVAAGGAEENIALVRPRTFGAPPR